MAIHWTISFMSLRAGTAYTVNIYDASYSGAAIPLIPGADPFTTEESNDDDPFTNIRTQSGYIRIVDNGKDDNGNAFDWRDLIPTTDTDRPVTLTDGNGNVVWQGFMQAQNFGCELYGNPQEREFPIQCPLTVLSTQQPTTQDIQIRNFAYLLNVAVTAPATMSGNAVTFSSVVAQGGTDAQQWLLKKFDWQNLLQDDNDEDVTPRYNIYQAIEDMCKFWGWTARTYKQTLYLTCTDDQAEQTFLTLTLAQLASMANGTASGDTSGSFSTVALTGDIFANTNNDDYTNRGPNKATVKADVNKKDTVVKFASPVVEKTMEQGGYTWVASDEDLVGYFTTPELRSFDSLSLQGSAVSTYGGFCRRHIYESKESTNATIADMFVFHRKYIANSPIIQIHTKKAMSFSGGSLSFNGIVFANFERWNFDDFDDVIRVRIGIGLSYETAKWYYHSVSQQGVITHGWSSTKQEMCLMVVSGSIKGVACPVTVGPGLSAAFTTTTIPVDNNISGFVYIDFLGMTHDWTEEQDSFEIGDFEIKFSRDETYIPSSWSEMRSRTMEEKRESSFKYVAETQDMVKEEWNADCIFASDNNLEYGYGLLMNANNSFMETAPYGNNNEHPEQHLANRVIDYWQTSRRMITTELISNAIAEVTPQNYVTLQNIAGHFCPLAISHQWRDDITILTLLEMP